METNIEKEDMKKYSDKQINTDYYTTIKFTKDAVPVKNLTEQEFKNCEPGIVWVDSITKKLIFKG